MVVDARFWNGRRVFLTGHTGFKGTWLAAWLDELGAKVTGYGLQPRLVPSLFSSLALERRVRHLTADVRDREALIEAMVEADPEIVFHLAAQPIVLTAYEDPVGTIETNVNGTLNLLEGVRKLRNVEAVIVVTSDKCYRDPSGHCREEDALGSDEPYGASKACAELLVHAWRKSFIRPEQGVGLATARAGNVIGAGDFSRYRLLPDLVRAAAAGKSPTIRYPGALRPWQHVLDALSGYLQLAQSLAVDPKRYMGAWNFGPHVGDNWTVAEVADLVTEQLGSAAWRQDPAATMPEAPIQRLTIDKAQRRLGWTPTLSTSEAVAWTVSGYKSFLETGTTAWLTEQIAEFSERLQAAHRRSTSTPAELATEIRHDAALAG